MNNNHTSESAPTPATVDPPQPEPARKGRPRGSSARRSMRVRSAKAALDIARSAAATSLVNTADLMRQALAARMRLCAYVGESIDVLPRLLARLTDERLDAMTGPQLIKALVDMLARLQVAVGELSGNAPGQRNAGPLVNVDFGRISDLLAAGERRQQQMAQLEAHIASLRARLPAAPAPKSAEEVDGGGAKALAAADAEA